MRNSGSGIPGLGITDHFVDKPVLDSDQAASDRDQASADRERVIGRADPETYDSTRSARGRNKISRLAARLARDRSTRTRDRNADDRDAIAVARDEVARQRDHREQKRERAYATSDEPLAKKFRESLSNAEANRSLASADRARAADDRREAAQDAVSATRERTELAEYAARLARRNALVAETIQDLRASDTPEATAREICRHIASLTGVAAASLLLFGLDGYAWPIDLVAEAHTDLLTRVPLGLSQYLVKRAAEGPWIEPWANQPENPHYALFRDLGIRSIACAPVRHNRGPIGLLVAGATTSAKDIAVAEVLPLIAEFADLAGALIGRDVAVRTEAERGRNYIADIIARRVFYPVFQPIVDLRSDEISGYEALIRFRDGANPESVFSQAEAVVLDRLRNGLVHEADHA
jgi:hypothetical protein